MAKKYHEYDRWMFRFGLYKKFQLLALAYNRAMGLQSPRETRSMRTIVKRPDGRSVESFDKWVSIVDWCRELHYLDAETWRITAANLQRLYH